MTGPYSISFRRMQLALTATWRRYDILIAIGIMLLALMLRLYRLGAQSLWLDEGSTWAIITGSDWGALVIDLVRPTAAYPLYHIILKGWIAIAGDSEWALRFPSAVAGALTPLVLFFAALELYTPRNGNRQVFHTSAALLAALLFAISPTALWYAQDAKVYSLLILVLALALWGVLRALRYPSQKAWVLTLSALICSLFVHRLALLFIAGVALALLFANIKHKPVYLALAVGCAIAGVIGLSGAVTIGWQESGHLSAGPSLGLWLAFVHFSLDRGNIEGYAGLPIVVWILPGLSLTLWGLALIVRDIRRREAGAIAVLCLFVVPIALFVLALGFAPIFEARYATIAFPAWILVLAYPYRSLYSTEPRRLLPAPFASHVLLYAPLCLLLLVNVSVLLQPKHGLFSGAAVKEEWRPAIQYLAGELHPDDLLIVHPYYTLPLWEYYAPRVTPDPLPQPIVFTEFAQGYCAEQHPNAPQKIRDCFRRETDRLFLAQAYGKKRAFLLIAPDHAKTVDRPKTLAELQAERGPNDPVPTAPDRYGWVGLRFQIPQRTWPCGGVTFVGVQVMCQSYPSAFGKTGPASELLPAVPLEVTFGNEIKLRGYSIDLLGGQIRRGGSLPITLYWEAIAKPTRNYTMFLHLCQDCTIPPLANTDHPPLHGYEPAGHTTTWRVGDPVHDERTLHLPIDLPPGHYTILLGVYPMGEPSIDTRLQASSREARIIDQTRVILSEIVVRE